MATKKDNLKEYLDYYIELESPGYAVLVTGEWGSGKTYRVKEAIPESRRYYTSLYGMETSDQVHAELYAAAFPRLSKAESAIKSTSKAASAMGGKMALANSIPLLFSSIVKKELSNDKILIFDDIERCNFDCFTALGVINSYVEHGGFKAIIILHDEKVKNGFTDSKEKTIGQTIRIEPNHEAAIESFLVNLNQQSAANHIREYKKEVVESYLMSGAKSLRTLKHTILDLARLYEILSPHHLKNKEAMQETIFTCTALSIESKLGNISKKEYQDAEKESAQYSARLYGRNAKRTKKPNVVKIYDKYPKGLTSKVMNKECLAEMFFDGKFDKDKITDSIENSVFFLEDYQIPPWKIIINFDNIEDDIIERAISRMEEMLQAKEIVIAGEILHTFSLKMLLVKEGVIEGSFNGVREEAISYITEIKNLKKITPQNIDPMTHLPESHDHIAFWVKDEYREHFNNIRQHLLEEQGRAIYLEAENVHEETLRLMHENAESLLHLLANTNAATGKYSEHPILKDMSAEAFVDAWLKSPVENWSKISLVLACRYHTNMLERYLIEEKPWATKVSQLMLERADSEKGLMRLRIQRAVPQVLNKLSKS